MNFEGFSNHETMSAWFTIITDGKLYTDLKALYNRDEPIDYPALIKNNGYLHFKVESV